MQHPKHRPFLSRPFYRDYVVAYVCIGPGAIICDLAISPKMRVLPLLFGATIAFAGAVFFCCAIGYSLRSIRQKRVAHMRGFPIDPTKTDL
jgi:hypothetical protein